MANSRMLRITDSAMHESLDVSVEPTAPMWNLAGVMALQLTNPTTLTSKNPGGPSAAMHECPFTAGMTNGVGKGMFSV